MNIGDKFIITGAYNAIGLLAINIGFVTVGKEYVVDGLDGHTPTYFFKDDVGAYINTYSFNLHVRED